jgi:predicted lipoprotein with Yx(FWY)xxD motif
MKNPRTLSISLIVVLVGVVVLLFAAGGSAKKASSGTVATRQTAFGKILVGAGGRTLYLFLADKPGVSTLSRAGFAAWPALVTKGAPQASGGASASKLRTITTRGQRQVTYNGHPLYYFVGDQRAGSTAGQGLFEFGAKWYVLSTNGKAVTSPLTSARVAPAPAPPQSSGGAYGY